MIPLLFTFAIVVLILYFSYFTTKWIGRKAVGTRGSRYMKILDTLAITQDKSVVLLQADKKYLLLSVSPTEMKLITELEDFVVPQATIWRWRRKHCFLSRKNLKN